MGHLTFVSKCLSVVRNKRILQFFDSACEPHSLLLLIPCGFSVVVVVVVLYSYIVEYAFVLIV